MSLVAVVVCVATYVNVQQRIQQYQKRREQSL